MEWLFFGGQIESLRKGMGPPTFGGGGGKRQKVQSVGLYKERPSGEVSLEEFERFSTDRRNVLTGIERAHAMGQKGDARREAIEKLLGQYLPERDRDEAQLAHQRPALVRPQRIEAVPEEPPVLL